MFSFALLSIIFIKELCITLNINEEIAVVSYEPDDEVKEKKQITLTTEVIPFYLEKLEAIVKENNGHLALAKVILVAFYVWNALICIIQHYNDTVNAVFEVNYPFFFHSFRLFYDCFHFIKHYVMVLLFVSTYENNVIIISLCLFQFSEVSKLTQLNNNSREWKNDFVDLISFFYCCYRKCTLL